MRAMTIKAAATVGLLAAVTGLLVAQTTPWPRESPPRPLPARPVPFPPYELHKLANGLQVVYVGQHEQPAVSVRLIVAAGSAHDPKDRHGLAMLTATLLDQGAGRRTAEQIADTIDFVGGVLSTGAGTDLSNVSAVVMKDSFELALELMADLVQRPTFAPAEIERQRQQAISALKVQAEDPDAVADDVINRLIYGFHPYGLPGNGTAESLTALTRADLVAFHRAYYVPNNALIAVVGDITLDQAMAGVEKYFGAWQPAELPAVKVLEPPEPTRRVIVIDKKDAVQTEIRVGQLALPRGHADFEVLDQAVKILGGEGANRLQQVLRSQRQLTYGASADLDAYKMAGAIIADTDTQTRNTAEALRVTVDEFARLQRERVSDDELLGAQNYMVGHFPLTIELSDAIATQVLNQLFYGLPVDDLPRYRDRILRVTAEDIRRVAGGILRPDRLSIVLVGDADRFVGDLKGVGFASYERIPIERLDLLSPDLLRAPAARPVAMASPRRSSRASGRAVAGRPALPPPAAAQPH